jgi:hypothetical protein
MQSVTDVRRHQADSVGEEAGEKLRGAGKLKEHRFRWSLIFSGKARANAENRP